MKTDRMSYYDIISYIDNKDCNNCVLAMVGENNSLVCAGTYYGKEITESLIKSISKKGCKEWEMSASDFIELCSKIDEGKI